MGGDGSSGGLVITVLGTPRVALDGEVVGFDTRKAIALLGFLAVTGRPQRRETVAALLWPDADDGHARSALRRTLSVVRKGLHDAGLRVTRDELELVDGPGVSIDVRSFLAGVDSTDIEAVAAATSLWRGDLLAGFTLRDSPEFDDWQVREGERLRRMLGTACARIVEARAAVGQVDDAIAHAERWLDLDRLHEPAHRALMRLHAHRGDRSAAIHQYRQCVRVVDEELGVAPLAETTALYEGITAGEFGPFPTSAPKPPTPPPPRFPLVGRAEELERLTAAVRPGGLVVVEGEPGVGKTRLVEELLARQERAVPMARCYDHDGDVPYAPLVELLRWAAVDPPAAAAIAALPQHCAVEVGRLVPELAPLEPGVLPAEGPGADARFVDGVARAVRAIGQPAPGILVVDDAQWADDASQQVLAHLVHHAGDDAPCLVMTQRTGEVADPGPLAGALAERLRDGRAASVRLGRLPPDAVAALVETAVDPAEVDRVTEEVVRESEGLPYLVVAYLDALVTGNAGPADVGGLLHSRLASLTDGAAQLLTAASVIGRSFSFEVVQAASGRSEDEAVAGLDELIARGLIEERATLGPSYDFTHDQVRRLVYDETSLARRRLLHHRVADALLAAIRPPATPDSVLAAVAHHERYAGRDDLAAEHFRRAGDHARAVHANQDARSHYDAALALGHPEVAALHEAIGDLETLEGRYVDAMASFERAAARVDAGSAARLEEKLGGVQQRRGSWSAAEQHYREALVGLGEGSDAARSRVEAELALTAHRQGDADRAAAHATAAIARAEEAGDDAARANAGTVAGLLAAGRGDLVSARRLLTESAALAAGLGDLAAQVATANGLARVEQLAGDSEQAHRILTDALDICAAIGDRHREAALRDQLAQILHGLGRHDEAMHELKRAVSIFADIGVEGGSVQTEVWRLTEWLGGSHPTRNDPGTAAGDNPTVGTDLDGRRADGWS